MKPHNYQKKAIKFMLKNPAAGLFMDPGLGKTACVLWALEALMARGVVKKTLIVASVRIIHSVWPREVVKWGLGFKIAMVHGDKKLKALKSKADIYLMNYEGLLWLNTQPKKLQKQFDVLVLDESTKVKNSSSLRFKVLKGMLDYFDRRYILTGTPIPNGMIDLFSQIYVLDQGESLGRFITHYRNEYFQTVNIKYRDSGNMLRQFPKITLYDDSEKRINKAVKHLIIRFDDSLIKMPKQVDNIIEVGLPSKVLKQYKSMESQLAVEIKKGVVLAANAGVATSKLRQIVNGHIFDNDGVSHVLHQAKIEALRELVEELQGKPLIVGYEYNTDLSMLLKSFPSIKVGDTTIKTQYIKGGTKPKDALKIERDWNRGRVPLLLGNISVLAHGLNLQGCGCHVAFYSQTWNQEDDYQFIRRVRRQGQKSSKVWVHRLVVSDSVDVDVINAVKSKTDNQKTLLDSFKRRVGV